MLVVLNSVVSVVDDETFITYAMYQNGGIDMSSGIDLEECSNHWYSSLNKDDKFVVEHLLDIKRIFNPKKNKNK